MQVQFSIYTSLSSLDTSLLLFLLFSTIGGSLQVLNHMIFNFILFTIIIIINKINNRKLKYSDNHLRLYFVFRN